VAQNKKITADYDVEAMVYAALRDIIGVKKSTKNMRIVFVTSTKPAKIGKKKHNKKLGTNG
jgi:hypothetical protein